MNNKENEYEIKRITIRIPAGLEWKIEECMEIANAKSKNDFINSAINFYIGYLYTDKSIEFVSPILAKTIKNQINSTEKNISEMLFKLSVETLKQSHILAAAHKINQSVMQDLNKVCCEQVSENNGIIDLARVNMYQNTADLRYVKPDYNWDSESDNNNG